MATSPPTAFADALNRAVGRSVLAAAVVDRRGRVLDWVGASEDDEQSALANLVALLEDDKVLTSLLRGALGVLSLGNDELSVVVAVAKRELYVIAMVRDSADTTIDNVRTSRDRVAATLPDPPRGSGGSAAGPAEL